MKSEFLDDKRNKQFIYRVSEGTSKVEYIRTQEKIYLTHTEVPVELQGKGVASVMIEKVFRNIEKEQLKIIPLCPFVAAYMLKHPEWKHLLDENVNLKKDV